MILSDYKKAFKEACRQEVIFSSENVLFPKRTEMPVYDVMNYNCRVFEIVQISSSIHQSQFRTSEAKEICLESSKIPGYESVLQFISSDELRVVIMNFMMTKLIQSLIIMEAEPLIQGEIRISELSRKLTILHKRGSRFNFIIEELKVNLIQLTEIMRLLKDGCEMKLMTLDIIDALGEIM